MTTIKDENMYSRTDQTRVSELLDSMKFDIGNIHKTSLKALWQGESWTKLRKMHQEGLYREEPICQECKVSRDGEFEEVLSI